MNNIFLSKKQRNPVIVKNNLDVYNLEMFPELKTNKQYIDESLNAINFKSVLTAKTKDEELEEKDIILPGWIKMTRKGNSIIYDNGITKLNHNIKTYIKSDIKSDIKTETETETDTDIDTDLNYNMQQAIYDMEYNWVKYEYIYDQIHGYNAFADKYRLPPVYGSEYDTESDTDPEESDFIASDDENGNGNGNGNDYDGYY